MGWKQQYSRFCRDCEYWDGLHNKSGRGNNFQSLKGTCHRFPPSHFRAKTGQYTKPITLDSDGCGEFKLVPYLQNDKKDHSTDKQNDTKELASQGLLSTKQVAALLSISARHAISMSSCGQIPMPIRLGRSVRWSKQELLNWIQAGCPPRYKWVSIKENS